jgi:hypothetical protein
MELVFEELFAGADRGIIRTSLRLADEFPPLRDYRRVSTWPVLQAGQNCPLFARSRRLESTDCVL